VDRNKTVRPERRQLELPSATDSPISVKSADGVPFSCTCSESRLDLCALCAGNRRRLNDRSNLQRSRPSAPRHPGRTVSRKATFQARSSLCCDRPFNGQIRPSVVQPKDKDDAL
jgi:hypothetical protein